MTTFHLSFFRPFSCRAFFVLYFVGADSMRFFADASPCAISLQFFNCALLLMHFSQETFPWAPSRGLFPQAFQECFLACTFSQELFPVHSFAWTISMDSLAVLFSKPAFAAQYFMGLSTGAFSVHSFAGPFFHVLFVRRASSALTFARLLPWAFSDGIFRAHFCRGVLSELSHGQLFGALSQGFSP